MTDTDPGIVHAAEAAHPAPAHPLDPATAASTWPAGDILADGGLLTEPVRFAYYGLEEPPKADVLARGQRAGPAAAGVPDRRGHRRSRPTSWSR